MFDITLKIYIIYYLRSNIIICKTLLIVLRLKRLKSWKIAKLTVIFTGLIILSLMGNERWYWCLKYQHDDKSNTIDDEL